MNRARFALPILCLFIAAGAARSQPAAADAWLTTPYKLDIVLHVQEHPLFTDVFKDLMQRELIDALKRDLGRIAEVQAERRHPWMDDIIKQGWSFLDGRQIPLDERKRHFVRVFYQDGQYEVQARQVDGVTGYVSTLRKAQTADRMWVSRIAALLVAQDFGITGRVTEVNGTTVRMQLKGVGVDAPPSVRVLGREVFYVFGIRTGRDGKPVGEKVEDTVLVVTGTDKDTCQTRLVSRYENPVNIKGKNAQEFRVIKLGTVYTPLQLRIVDRQTGQPLNAHGVAVSPDGFQNMTDLGPTDSFGRIRSKEAYHNVVCVRVTYQGRTRLMTPIALLDDQVVEKSLINSAEIEKMAEFDGKHRKWQLNLHRVYSSLEAEFLKITDLLKNDKVPQAVESAKAESAKLHEEMSQVGKEYATLKSEAEGLGKAALNVIKADQHNLDIVGAKIKELDEFVQEQTNPTPAQTKYHQARILEGSGDVDEAMKLYEEALQLDEEAKKLSREKRDRIARLQRIWELKGDEHKAAREFVFQQWDKVEVEQLDKFIPEAEKHLKLLMSAKINDYLTVGKLNKINLAVHLEHLRATITRLAEIDSDEAAEKLDAMKQTLEKLRNLYVKAAEYLQKAPK
jgi:hypothetical protein